MLLISVGRNSNYMEGDLLRGRSSSEFLPRTPCRHQGCGQRIGGDEDTSYPTGSMVLREIRFLAKAAVGWSTDAIANISSMYHLTGLQTCVGSCFAYHVGVGARTAVFKSDLFDNGSNFRMKDL